VKNFIQVSSEVAVPVHPKAIVEVGRVLARMGGEQAL